MATSYVKRESYFMRFRKRWRRRGVIEIDESHPKHDFTMHVRQGLQDSITRTESNGVALEFNEDDFSEELGSKLTSADDKTKFDFVSYAPKVFASLRDQVGMTPEIYHECICPREIGTKYLEFKSNSKSGQNFFLSNDKQLMIKTHTATEKHFFLKILPKYIEHLKHYPHTLLVRYLGLYKITINRHEPVYFVVMQSILFPDERISVRYDLKACEAGRFTKDKSENDEVITVLKDVNFGGRKLKLGTQSLWFRLQVQHDTEFLRNLRVIDYSLLVGVQPLHVEEIRENKELASIVVRAKKSTSRQHSVLKRWASPTKVLSQINEESVASPESSTEGSPEKLHLPGSVEQESGENVQTTNDSPSHLQGTISPGAQNGPGTRDSVSETEAFIQNRRLLPECRNELHVIDGLDQERYFIGIIDFFTPYGIKKRFESLYKAMKYKKSGTSFSTVNPDAYAERFQEFVTSHVE